MYVYIYINIIHNMNTYRAEFISPSRSGSYLPSSISAPSQSCNDESQSRCWIKSSLLQGSSAYSKPNCILNHFSLWHYQSDPRDKLQCNLNQNTGIFLQENAFENMVRKIATILLNRQCTKLLVIIFSDFWITINSFVNTYWVKNVMCSQCFVQRVLTEAITKHSYSEVH